MKSSADVRNKLKLKQFDAQNKFKKSFPEAHKYLKEKGVEVGKLREHSSKLLTAGAAAGTLFLSPGGTYKLPPPHSHILSVLNTDDDKLTRPESPFSPISKREYFTQQLNNDLPDTIRPLTTEEEKDLEYLFQDVLGVPAVARLEGQHLNTTYGRIGAEQHLRRYPGDVNENHAPKKGQYGADNPSEILKEGMAPGLGAWGYFAQSKADMTPELEEIERWYAVVQTLYLPDWNYNQPHLKNWYKYRKVLIVNTDNGKAVVASIADSGPAAWTGKHYGGSPEVMDYLGGPRYKKGPVVVFFVDDPDNKVPLGPVEYGDTIRGIDIRS